MCGDRGRWRLGAVASCAQRSERCEEANLEEEAFPGGGAVSLATTAGSLVR